MTSRPSDVLPSPDASSPEVPLRIQCVIPPEPHHAPGSYEVRLQLSRPLTSFEVRALHPIARRMQAVGCVLTLSDTTLEHVAAQAKELAALLRRVEEEGRRLEQAAQRREEEYRAHEEEEARRLTTFARSISFD